MASIEVSTVIACPVAAVWADLRQLDTHVTWMGDAEAIRFLTDQTSGVGTRFECDTRVGPLRTTDVMEVTEWVEEHRIGVRHVGVVTGDGVFVLRPAGPHHTEMTWSETLVFPWWLGGPVAAWAARPVLAAIWGRNLARLDQRLVRG